MIEDVEVWRAATGVEASDRRVIGPIQLDATARTWQEGLEDKLHVRTPSTWMDMLMHIHPEIHNDPYAAVLAHRISALHEAGFPVSEIVATVIADGPLPAEHPAAALWWRLSRHLNATEPTVTPPESSTSSPHAENLLTDDLDGAHDARPGDATAEVVVNVTEVREDEQRSTPGVITTWTSAMAAAGSAQDRALHSPAPPQSAEARWRNWGNQANPALLESEHWQEITVQLDRLDPATVDFARMGRYLGTLSANVVLEILKNHNEPEPAEISGERRPHEAASPTLKANERHRRRSGYPRPSDGPRR